MHRSLPPTPLTCVPRSRRKAFAMISMAFVLLALTLGLSAQTTSQVTTAATNGLSFAVTDALNFTNSQGCIACHRQGGVVYGAAQGVATGLPLSTTTLNQLDQLAARLASDQISGGYYDGAWLHQWCCYPWSKGGWAGFGLANYDQDVKPLYGSNLQRNLDYNLRVLGNNYTITFPNDGHPFAGATRRYVPQDHGSYPTTWVWQIPTAQTEVVIAAALQHPDIASANGTTYRQYMSDLADVLEGAYWRPANPQYSDEVIWELIGTASAGRTIQSGDPTGTLQAMETSLLGKQNSDGGWGEYVGAASDPYHTGLALYALHLEGLRLDQSPAVQQAVNWLLARQNPDGTWTYGGHAADLPTTFAAIGLAAYGPSNFALTLAPTSATVTPNVGTTQTVTFHATVNNSGYVSGTYAITLSGGLPGTTLAASPASLSLSPAQTGTSTITVVLPAQLPQGAIMPITVTAAGTTVNGTASKSQTFTIGAGALPGPNAVPTTTVWTSAPSTAQSGTPVTLSAVVRDSGGGAVTAGTLTFYVGTRAVAATLANGSGVYQTQWIVDGSFGVGAEPLIAAYNGYASGGTGTDYKPSSANASINITKPAASAALGNLNQSYDGTPKSVTVTTTPAGLATSVTYNGAATLPIAAGSYAVQATITDNNYVSQPANGTLTIAKATPQVSAPTNLSISYGTPSTVIAGRVGLATVAATGTVTVVLNGVSQNASLAADGTYSAAFNTGRLGVATYPVNILYNGDSNFAVGTGAASLTVTAIPLSVQVASATHVYGVANPVFTGTISGLVNGDVVTATYSSAATSNVGSYPITVALSGSALSNYVPTISNGTLTITPAPLTVTVASATHVYGAANPVFTGTISGLVNGDVVTATYSSVAATSNAGSYAITAVLSGSALSNYVPAISNGTLTITPAPLTVAVASATRLYGAANPAFTGTLTGLVNGDVLTATYSSAATVTSGVGTYPITAALSGSALGNYTPAITNGTLTVTPAPLAVTIQNATRMYGAANPTFTAVYSGVLNGDVLNFSGITAAGATTDTGAYAITGTVSGAAAANYTATYTNGTLTITPAPLSVTVVNASRLYGTLNPVFTGAVVGVLNGDAITASYSSAATPLSNVGPYAITATLSGPSVKLADYAVSNQPGVLIVTPTPLLIAANDTTKVLHAPNPTFTATYTGFVLGQGPSVLSGTLTCTSTAVTASNVGSYPISCSGQTSTNYAVSYAGGTLKVLYSTGSCGRRDEDEDGHKLSHVILEPIAANGSSIFELGRAVPVKFRLCDANGAPVATPSAVTAFTADNGPAPTSRNPRFTTFRGDEDGQLLIFNLDTRPLAAMTYGYQIHLNDGSVIAFSFTLRAHGDDDHGDNDDHSGH